MNKNYCIFAVLIGIFSLMAAAGNERHVRTFTAGVLFRNVDGRTSYTGNPNLNAPHIEGPMGFAEFTIEAMQNYQAGTINMTFAPGVSYVDLPIGSVQSTDCISWNWQGNPDAATLTLSISVAAIEGQGIRVYVTNPNAFPVTSTVNLNLGLIRYMQGA